MSHSYEGMVETFLTSTFSEAKQEPTLYVGFKKIHQELRFRSGVSPKILTYVEGI